MNASVQRIIRFIISGAVATGLIIVLLYGLALLIAREIVDRILEYIKAPDWTYWVPLIAAALVWFIGGNIMFFRLRKPKKGKRDPTVQRALQG